MSRAQSAANAPCLPVDIAGLVAAEEQGDAGDLVGDPASEHRVQLPDLPHRPPGPRFLVRVQRHPRFDQAWTDGVATDSGAGELVTCCLHHRYDGCFGGRVVGCREGKLIEKEGTKGRNEVVTERGREGGREGGELLEPALERRPATDAVAIMEPEGCGLESEGWRMALAACLVARKTLRGKGLIG